MSRTRTSFRTRLVIAMVALSLGVLGMSYVATYALVRRSLQQHALTNLRSRAGSLTGILSSLNVGAPGETRRERLAQLAAGLKLTDMAAVQILPDGTVADIGGAARFELPAGVTQSDIEPNELLAGKEVSGRRGNTVYLALPLAQVGRRQIVVVATDRVDTRVLTNALPLLFLAGVVVLAIATAVALWLARRLTRPMIAIQTAARSVAAGDLAARADVPPGTDDELAALAQTLNRMTEQIERSRGSERAFLLSISHDLRTPLTSIRGYADALADGTLDEADPEERLRAATIIGAEARRLERLVRDLLDLARLDSRQFSLHPRPCDAAAVVRDAAEAFAPKADELAITLSVAAGTPIPAHLDPERLAQIVANLVENALKFARATVDVSVTPGTASGVSVVVSDDGPGIAAPELSRVFDRLYTVRESPGRSVGTGLGLAIVRELAGAMGGHAWAEAAAEGGSRFIVTVPSSA